MRKQILILVSIILSMNLFSQNIILHSDGNQTLFTGVDAFIEAVNDASSGDTLYLSGNTFNSSTTINKQLTIYGSGIFPDSTYYTGKTILSDKIYLGENASGSSVEGVEFAARLETANNISINNLTFKYCNFSYGISISGNLTNPATNLIFINNISTASIDFSNIQYAQIYNNVWRMSGSSSPLSVSNSVIANNIFTYGTNNVNVAGIIGSYNTIKNNYFNNSRSTSTAGINGEYNEVFNNIFNLANPSFGSDPIYSENIIGLSTNIFVNLSGIYNSDYNLIDPDEYIGNDGTQIGLYGGLYPFKAGAVPSNPHFINSYIGNHTTNDGMLNIDIKVSAQDE
ncbi:MAG: hypothetical protein GX879_09510 [Bacteroidales bacterium]|nr:hypothetical protein [Bacteroidales bacterium]